MDTTRRYVVGFLFWGLRVALILKDHPGWQEGKLNGVGGKIEPGETTLQAMQREFQEEAGLDIQNWEQFCFLHGKDWEVTFFKATLGLDASIHFRSDTDEPVDWYLYKEVLKYSTQNLIPNLKWLIPLALGGDLMADVRDYNKYTE